MQPPSRGCVLKQLLLVRTYGKKTAAAFARLCVETVMEQTPALAQASSRLRAAVC